MSFCFSSISRKSLCSTAFGNFSEMPLLAIAALAASLSSQSHSATMLSLLRHVDQVRRAHAVRVADDGDVDGVARRLEPGAEHVARHDRDAGSGGGGAHERAAGHLGGWLLLVGHRLLSCARPTSRGGWNARPCAHASIADVSHIMEPSRRSATAADRTRRSAAPSGRRGGRCATRSRQMYPRSTIARAKSCQRSFDPGLSCHAGRTSS